MTTTTRLITSVIAFKFILIIWGVLHTGGPLWSMWNQWDSHVYTTIATQWYTPANIPPDYFGFLSHFPPVYPIAIFLISHFFSVMPQVAGILISWGAIIAASYFFYRLVLDETGDILLATGSVLFLTIWPLSYFTLAVYAESLSLLFLILSFYAIRKKHFVWAGVAGAASILTRLPSIMIIPAYGVILWKMYRQHDPLFRRAAVSLILAPVIAIVMYLGINSLSYGDPFFFQHEYATNPYSSKHLIIPFQETVSDLKTLIVGIPTTLSYDFMMLHGWNVIFTIAATIITVIGIRILPLEYTVFSLGSILFFASFSWGISNARYTLPIFPLFMVLGRLKPSARILATILSLCLLLYFTSIFVTGAWTF